MLYRNAVRVLVVAGLVGFGWAAGLASAEAPAPVQKAAQGFRSIGSHFELQVSQGDEGIEVRCVRGCTLTWAPRVGQTDVKKPGSRLRGTVNANGCITPSFAQAADNCHILGWRH